MGKCGEKPPESQKCHTSGKSGKARKGVAAAAAGDGSGLLEEQIAPRAELPPLLLSLSQRPPERLHWLEPPRPGWQASTTKGT